MRVQNISKRKYVHSVLNAKRQANMLVLNPGENKEIPDEVAEQWLKTGEVIKYADPVEVEQLKAELAALKAEKQEKTLDDLKKEADELGIKYVKNIGFAKLQEKINAFKNA